MRLLYGAYDISLDEKNRMLVPAEIRRAIDPVADGEALFAVTGINGKLWMYPEKYYEALAARVESEMAPQAERLEFDLANFALACRLAWDKQGRILIPDRMLRKAGLGKELTVIGARDHAEIWNRQDWSAQEEQLERRRLEIAALVRSNSKGLNG